MSLLRAAIRALVVLAVVVVAVVLLSGGSGYVVRLRMSDGGGLRDGSKVVEGGVQVGTVSVGLGAHDTVRATLHIESRYAPIGRDATAQIVSLNLLGQKSLQLSPGDRHNAAPSGFTLPTTVTPATDLDQVLDVLAPDTRSRLTVLIDEAGAAFVGRREDFSALLAELPNSLSAGAELLGRLDGENATLSDLVAHSDGFISRLDTQSGQLGRLVDTLGQTAATVEPRDAQLQATLRRLPGTLQSAQRFLVKLRDTTVPLGPAAEDLQAVAAPLQSTLEQIAPFTSAARPTLAQASTEAPELTELATDATPVLRTAVPTLSALSTATTDAEPVTNALSLSIDNIIGTAWNWSHAVELRDGLSHLFRAEFTFTPTTLQYLVSRLLAAGGGNASAERGGASARVSDPVRNGTPAPSAPAPSTPAATSAAPLAAPTTPAPTATTPTASPLSGLASLLGFLTGR
jgi:phospholipid/cholesterol/gamma-HCH transport system substrate-binding protein